MAKRKDCNPRRMGFARLMRHEPTDAERRMWSILRGRQLDGFKFRRQHRIDCYIVDFCCVREKLVLELDGGQHYEPERLAYDAARTRRLEELGFGVLRFADDVVLKETDAVAETIYRELLARAEVQGR